MANFERALSVLVPSGQAVAHFFWGAAGGCWCGKARVRRSWGIDAFLARPAPSAQRMALRSPGLGSTGDGSAGGGAHQRGHGPGARPCRARASPFFRESTPQARPVRERTVPPWARRRTAGLSRREKYLSAAGQDVQQGIGHLAGQSPLPHRFDVGRQVAVAVQKGNPGAQLGKLGFNQR